MGNKETLVVVTPELSPQQRELLNDIEALCMKYLMTIRVPYGAPIDGPVGRAREAVGHTVLELRAMKEAGELE